MVGRLVLAGVAAASLGRVAAQDTPLVSVPGQVAAIPEWNIQSSSDVSDDLKAISKPGGADTSSWIDVPISKCTLMACLIAAGLHSDEELWYSENLKDFNWGQFTVPWVYRHEFGLEPEEGVHYLLQTNGITSRGDIYLNGELVADKDFQSGSYTGHEFDITEIVADSNALLIQAYPTDYTKDLAMGFIDWNPVPPDNGTGVWRDVTVKQTGAVALGPLRAVVDIDPGKVVLRSTLRNLEDKQVQVAAKAVILEPSGGDSHTLYNNVTLGAGESKTVEFEKTFEDPQLWWPRLWGKQPLYQANVTASTGSSGGSVSDVVSTQFGLRTVTSEINDEEDILFTVNNEPFQVIGAGYGADMFMRFDPTRFEAIAKYMLDMGMNTIRLEGNNEQPELYEICDRLGLMVMAGWECCNKWESWEFNDHLENPDYWDEADYADANATIQHEALMFQTHPSMLTFLVGSDFWPDDKATKIYVDALRGADFQLPIVAAASKRGYPKLLGPSGMKMDGPYDWVPPNYWYDTEGEDDRLGAAFGFGSELGAGVGTPELSSLKRFLSESDLEDLWKNPNKGLYHMSTNVSSFYDRAIFNQGIWKRYGTPSSLEDYLRKVQVADYEAIRAEFEAFSANWGAEHQATGLIYWMLNSAWPNLHWGQFDYYLHPAGTYYGTKTGSRAEHVAYNYQDKSFHIINHGISNSGARTIDVDVVNLSGKELASESFSVDTKPNSGAKVDDVPGLDAAEDVVFVRFVLKSDEGEVLSRNVHWVAPTIDELDWSNSTWFSTPVSKYADYTSLFDMDEATVKTNVEEGDEVWTVTLENESDIPAFFLRLNLVDADAKDVNPVTWSDNYVTLFPGETLELTVDSWGESAAAVLIDGANVAGAKIEL